MSKNVLIPILILFLVGIVGFWWYQKTPLRPAVTNFDECVVAGYPVAESYPEQCVSPDGTFIREISEEPELPADLAEHIASKSDLIVVSEPRPLSVITSPLIVRGQARGNWYFEASFPITLVNWDGLIIAQGHAEAQLDPNDPNSTWMTEDLVPFEGTLEFKTPEDIGDFSRRGAIILQKDNPSGLPEHDDALELTIYYR